MCLIGENRDGLRGFSYVISVIFLSNTDEKKRKGCVPNKKSEKGCLVFRPDKKTFYNGN